VKCNSPKHGSGLPCQRDVAPGFTRCNLHGGANPAAKIKAEQMLAQARMPACEALYDIIERYQLATCPTCLLPTGDIDQQKVIIRAAQVILDRSGMGPRSTVEHTKQTDGDLDLELLTDAEMQEMDLHLTALKELKTRVRQRLGMLPTPAPALAPEAGADDFINASTPERKM
jgi:hypothetical protein